MGAKSKHEVGLHFMYTACIYNLREFCIACLLCLHFAYSLPYEPKH